MLHSHLLAVGLQFYTLLGLLGLTTLKSASRQQVFLIFGHYTRYAP